MNTQPDLEDATAPDVGIKDDRGVSDKLVFTAVIVGLILTAVGGWITIYATAYTPGVHFAALIACCGLAITLAAFGGRAAGKWHSWAVTGAAALAIALFVLQYELEPKPTPPALRGELRGTQSFQQISMWASSPMFVTRRHVPGSFEFAAFPDDLDQANTFHLYVTNKSGTDPQEFYIYCIPTSILANHLGDLTRLDLSVRNDQQQAEWRLFDKSNNAYGQDNDDCSAPKHVTSNVSRPRFQLGLSFAHAQTTIGVVKPSDVLGQYIFDLNAQDSDTRESACREISLLDDKASLRFTVDLWNIKDSNYRDDLGRLVAWNLAVKNNKAVVPDLLDVLDVDKTKYLIALSGYPDQTMRSQANSLLTLLATQAAPIASPEKPQSQAFFKQIFGTLQDPQAATAQTKQKGIAFSTSFIRYGGLLALKGAECGPTASKQSDEIVQMITSPEARSWFSGDTKASALADDIKNKKCR